MSHSFCWWRYNRLLMKSQWPDNCDAITWIMIFNSLDINFIHGDFHGLSCKKYISDTGVNFVVPWKFDVFSLLMIQKHASELIMGKKYLVTPLINMITKFMLTSFIDLILTKVHEMINTVMRLADKDLSTLCRTHNEAPYDSIVIHRYSWSSSKRYGAP